MVYNHADYRLMSRRALEALAEYREENLFLRGLVPQLGFRSGCVYYERHERFAGESKYPLKKMISFALDGVTSFSVKPLRMIAALGVLVSLLSVAGLLYALISHALGRTVAGWTAIVSSIWLLGGLQNALPRRCGRLCGENLQRSQGAAALSCGRAPEKIRNCPVCCRKPGNLL